MPFGSGISAMIRAGAALELEPNVGLETISIGAPPNSFAEGYELESAGTFLCYTIALRGAEVHLSVALMDSTAEPDHLLKTPDSEDGWRLVFAFVSSLERYAVQDLTRPIVVGDPAYHDPSTCWIIA